MEKFKTPQGSVYVVSNAVVEFSETKKPTETVETQTSSTGKHIPWGSDNLFPQRVAEECRKSTIIPSRLNAAAEMIYAGGLTFGKLGLGSDNEEVFTPYIFTDKEVRAHLRKLNFERYCMEASLQMVWSWSVFVEVFLSLDRTKIMGLKVHPSRECRFEWPDPKTGKIKNVYINANWANDASGTKAVKLPFIDVEYDAVTAIKEAKGYNFMLCLQLPDFDNKYYKLAPWDGARQSGWLDLSLSIPAFKKALMINQITLKYMIRVTDEYMNWKYPGYNDMKDTEKVERQAALVGEFNNLKGEDNTGKSLLSLTSVTPSGESIPGITIEAIDDKLKEGVYIEDSQEASTHLLTALAEDPTLSGNGPGKQYGAGSGSDKGMAFNIKMSTIRIRQDLLTQPFGLMRDYNGWDEDYVFRFRNSLMTTQSNMQKTQQV